MREPRPWSGKQRHSTTAILRPQQQRSAILADSRLYQTISIAKMPPAPVLFSLTYHTFQTSNLLLSGAMILSPALYHTHILRSTQSSTLDLYRETQFTERTKEALHDQVRTTGITLLSTSLFLLSSRGPSSYISYRAIFFTSTSVVLSHGLLLRPVLLDKDVRNSWLRDRKRVGKLLAIIGVNAVVVVLSLWASTGWWPWPSWETSLEVGFDERIGGLVEGVINKFGDGAGILFRTFLSSS